MAWCEQNILSILWTFPFLWALLTVFLPLGQMIHGFCLLGSLILCALGIYVWQGFDPMQQMNYFLSVPWIKSVGAYYAVGIDASSLLLVMLTIFLLPLVVLGCWNNIKKEVPKYYFFLFTLISSILGSFLALDLFLFYAFWEVMLIPLIFLIGIWGAEQREYAAIKFFLFTVVGSLIMLVGIFYLVFLHHQQFGVLSSLLVDLQKLKISFLGLNSEQALLFLAFGIAFAIKIPCFPLHTWLPDAHVQASTAGSVLLAGVLLKVGGYGFLRFCFTLFPQAAHFFQPFMMSLAVIAILYGACLAMVQTDIKKCVAYSSISHMGYVVLGLFSLNLIGLTGAVLQMINHGISTSALFLMVGMLYERRHTKQIAAFGGIAKSMPLFTLCFMIVTFSSIALPITNGFIGEFLILLGAFQAQPLFSAFAAIGVILGAVYMLWLVQRIFFGPLDKKENQQLLDLRPMEIIALMPLIIGIFLFGIFPQRFIQMLNLPLSKVLYPFNL